MQLYTRLHELLLDRKETYQFFLTVSLNAGIHGAYTKQRVAAAKNQSVFKNSYFFNQFYIKTGISISANDFFFRNTSLKSSKAQFLLSFI